MSGEWHSEVVIHLDIEQQVRQDIVEKLIDYCMASNVYKIDSAELIGTADALTDFIINGNVPVTDVKP